MSETLEAVQKLVAVKQVRISEHGYEEITADGIYVRDILASVDKATIVEDYPAFSKGPAVLVLQWDKDAKPIHSCCMGNSEGIYFPGCGCDRLSS